MRMWGVDPKVMCQQHLLGEHVEMHMFVGSIKKKKNIAGFISGGLVEIHNIMKRHKQLEKEMVRRGLNHQSPLPTISKTILGKVDRETNLVELAKRCRKCRGLQNK